MDSWILGLRADEDVQLEYRALLGPSIRTIGRVEVHAFEASSHEAAARIFDSAAASLGYGTAAVACDEAAMHEDGAEVQPAIERVVALCMTAAPGSSRSHCKPRGPSRRRSASRGRGVGRAGGSPSRARRSRRSRGFGARAARARRSSPSAPRLSIGPTSSTP